MALFVHSYNCHNRALAAGEQCGEVNGEIPRQRKQREEQKLALLKTIDVGSTDE